MMTVNKSLLAGLMVAGVSVSHAQEAPIAEETKTLSKLVAVDSNDTEGTGSYAPSATGTATGLNLSLRETPQSITVITQEQINDQNMTTVSDALRSAAGVSIKVVDSVRTDISVRGFNVDSYQYDGVPVPTGNNVNHDLANIAIYDRVEVVRGATGLLNGPGQPSAAINLIRKHANSREFTGSINAEVGRWDRQALTVDLSTPLNSSGTVRGRVVVSGSRQESFIDWEESKNQVFYGVLDADLGDATKLSLGASHQAEDRDDVQWYPLPVWYADGSRTNWDRSKNTAADWSEWLTEEDTAFLTLTHRFGDTWTLRVDASRNKNVDDEKLLWWDGYPDRNTGLGMVTAGYQWANNSELNQISTLLSGSFQWLGREHELSVGILYSDFESRWHDVQDDPNAYMLQSDFIRWNGTGYPEPAWGAAYLAAKDTTRQFATYAVARFNVHDRLKLITGARLSDWHWKTDQAVWTSETLKVDKQGIVTPYAGVVFDVTDAISTYASYTSIFKPQTSYRDHYGKYLDPLEGNSYELGVKGEWLEGALFTNAAVFYTDQDNFAIEDGAEIVLGTGPGTDVVATQAYYAGQGVKSQGYELEVVGKLTEQWNLSTSWVEFSAKDAQDVDVAVDHPRRQFKLSSTYKFSNSLDGWRMGGAVNWQSRQLRRTENPGTHELEAIGQKAYGLVDVMLGYAITSNLDVQLNVFNVFDKEYKDTSFWDAFTYGEPRNVQLSMNFSF